MNECNCELFQTPSYHASQNPHSVIARWRCSIHGLEEKTWLIHEEKQDNCVPCHAPKATHTPEWEKELEEMQTNPGDIVTGWILEPAKVKHFITQLLATEQDRVIRVLEGLLVGMPTEKGQMYNKAIKDAVEALRV